MKMMPVSIVEKQQVVRRRSAAFDRNLYPAALSKQKPVKRVSSTIKEPLQFRRKPEDPVPVSSRKTRMKPGLYLHALALKNTFKVLAGQKQHQIVIFFTSLFVLLSAVTVAISILMHNNNFSSFSLHADPESALFFPVLPLQQETGGKNLPDLTILNSRELVSYIVKKMIHCQKLPNRSVCMGTLISYNQIEDGGRSRQEWS